MSRMLSIFCCVLTSPALAEDVRINFDWSDFTVGYVHQLFIDDGRLLYIHHPDLNDNSDPYVPMWVSGDADANRISNYLVELVELGVGEWEAHYPDGPPPICDGLGWNISIRSEALTMSSSGACASPDTFDQVVRATLNLVQDVDALRDLAP